MILLIVFGSLIFLGILGMILRNIKNKKKRDLKIENHQTYLNSIEKTEKRKPNIIIFFMDDMGFADISCYGAKNIYTPNIDSLAENGVKFTTFYSASPVWFSFKSSFINWAAPSAYARSLCIFSK